MKKTMVFIVNFDSWWIRRVTSGEGACRAGGPPLARELNTISETLLRPWDSIPFFRHYREWMFSDSFRVFDFEVGGPSHNISTCLRGAAATSVPRRDRPSRPPAAVS